MGGGVSPVFFWKKMGGGVSPVFFGCVLGLFVVHFSGYCSGIPGKRAKGGHKTARKHDLPENNTTPFYFFLRMFLGYSLASNRPKAWQTKKIGPKTDAFVVIARDSRKAGRRQNRAIIVNCQNITLITLIRCPDAKANIGSSFLEILTNGHLQRGAYRNLFL